MQRWEAKLNSEHITVIETPPEMEDGLATRNLDGGVSRDSYRTASSLHQLSIFGAAATSPAA